MTDKHVIAEIDIGSNEYDKKVEIALQKGAMISTPIVRFDNDSRYGSNYALLLLNTRASNRMVCGACGGKFWVRVHAMSQEITEDGKGSCPRCSQYMLNMAMMDAKADTIKAFLTSGGEMNPDEILRELFLKQVKDEELVPMSAEEFRRLQAERTKK